MNRNPPSRRKALVGMVVTVVATVGSAWFMLALVSDHGIEGMAVRGLFLSAPLVLFVPMLVCMTVASRRPRRPRIVHRRSDEGGVVLRLPVAAGSGMPVGALALGLYCGALVVISWSAGIPTSGVDLQFRIAFWAALGLAVVSAAYVAVWVVELARGGLAPGHVGLGPEGLDVRAPEWRVRLGWSDICTVEVEPNGLIRIQALPSAPRAQRTSRLRVWGPRVPTSSCVEVVGASLVPDPVRLVEVIQHYRDHPEDRVELGAQQGPDELRERLARS